MDKANQSIRCTVQQCANHCPVSYTHLVNDAVTGKIDEIEEDSNFLEIDPDAAKVSFTSEKNPAHESIQVILRTQEISLDDDTEEAKDLETEAEDIGFWGRVVEVFKNIWNTIVGLFT